MPTARPAVLAIISFLVLGLLTIPCLAQTETATISGRVTDQTGAVITSATVQLRSAERGTTQTTVTNGSGIYIFPAVQPGVYHITIRKEGFRQVDYVGLTANTQAHIDQNFRLQLGPASESVTVSGDVVNINTADATVSTVIDRKFVANMPLNGRSFQDLLTLAPGVVQVGGVGDSTGYSGEFAVNGQRRESNYYTVDGVSANVGTSPGDFGSGAGVSGSTPAGTVVGTTQSMVSVDALQEFRANTSTYSAEYGRTPGGQFAFTTRSGANDWHGTAYDYFRNEALDANNWFADQVGEPKGKERQNDFGGTLGGPVVVPGLYNGRNKTFMFFSYEGLRLWTPQGVVTGVVPDQDLRQNAPAALQPILNAFPIANAGNDEANPGFGFYQRAISNPSSIDSVSIRADQNFGSRFKLFGRFADTPSELEMSGTAITDHKQLKNKTLTIGATTVFTPRQTNEFRFNITDSYALSETRASGSGGGTLFDISSLPGPNGLPFPSKGYMLYVGFFFGNATGFSLQQTEASQRQYNITDSHSWTVDRHNLKFGFDWRRLSTYIIPGTIQEDVEFYSEDSVLNNMADYALAASRSPSPVRPIYQNFSAFAQDDWKVTPRLSISLGLRWDINPAPKNGTGISPYTVDQVSNLATIKLAPAGTPLWQTKWLGFAPRLGLAYQLRRTPGRETVVRGGFGKFFDMGTSQGSNGFDGIGFKSSGQFAPSPFPLTSPQVTLPSPDVSAPYNSYVYGFDSHLTLPYTLEWNIAVEQSFGGSNALTVSYLGAAARNLATTFEYYPENVGNPNFNADVCSGCLYLTTNHSDATSDYAALQAQFRTSLSRGLQFLASYTWSHSLDTASVNQTLAVFERASSDFDVRHNVQAALTYEIPGNYSNSVVSGVLKHWGLDVRLTARTAFPVDVFDAYGTNTGNQTAQRFHPDIVPGVPLYLYGSQYPGGRVINYDAFAAVADPDGNPVEGNTGRNVARGFGAWQANVALRRDFPIHERLRLQFRAEAFNLFNHPSFSGIYNFLAFGPCSPPGPGESLFCFGTASDTPNNTQHGANALYQSGGPRSLQLALKLIF